MTVYFFLQKGYVEKYLQRGNRASFNSKLRGALIKAIVDLTAYLYVFIKAVYSFSLNMVIQSLKIIFARMEHDLCADEVPPKFSCLWIVSLQDHPSPLAAAERGSENGKVLFS